MKKKVIGILVCMMLLCMIPIAAGLNSEVTSSEPIFEPTPIPEGKKTFVVGITTKPRLVLLGQFITFKCFRVFYFLRGAGVITKVTHLQRLTFRNDYRGIITNHFVLAVFNGRPITL
jgi:hypothetical protein